MDLIYTDINGNDAGVLSHFSMDHEVSSEDGKNTFQIKIGSGTRIPLGAFIYANDTEYGGKITKLEANTSNASIKYTGVSWRGLLEKKIITPNSNEDYLVLSGDLNEIIKELIRRADLLNVFTVSIDRTIQLTNYKFDRYVSVYQGIKKMLAAYNYKLHINCSEGVCNIKAVQLINYANEREITSDLFSFKLSRENATCNHIIALGSGELKNRMVVHKYVQSDGSIGDIQYYTGVNDVTEVLDYPNVESLDELTSKAIETLKEKHVNDGLSITAYDLNADMGDKITASNMDLDISVTQYVVTKIVTINDDYIKYQYKVGDIL